MSKYACRIITYAYSLELYKPAYVRACGRECTAHECFPCACLHVCSTCMCAYMCVGVGACTLQLCVYAQTLLALPAVYGVVVPACTLQLWVHACVRFACLRACVPHRLGTTTTAWCSRCHWIWPSSSSSGGGAPQPSCCPSGPCGHCGAHA